MTLKVREAGGNLRLSAADLRFQAGGLQPIANERRLAGRFVLSVEDDLKSPLIWWRFGSETEKWLRTESSPVKVIGEG